MLRHSFAALACVLLAGCASPGAFQPTSAVVAGACRPTELRVEYRSEPSAFWRDRLDGNVHEVNAILRSKAFLERCSALPLDQTNGKSVRQVCEEIACRGPTAISVGFFHDPHTKAIAFEQEGMISLNTAREADAGSPGNLAHEFAHQLGYTHVATFEYLGARSVPYGVGYLVDRLTRDLWAR